RHGTAWRLEDRLRRSSATAGRPRRAGAVPSRRLLPPEVPPAWHALLLLGPTRQGVGPGPPPRRPAAVGELRRRPRRPVPRRPEVDERQGLRRVARGRPHPRRPYH